MKYWSLVAPKSVEKVEIDELRFPAQAEEMVKVKVTKAVVSPSDVAMYKGAFDTLLPVVPARCAAALVSECPSGSLQKGEKVFLSAYTRNDQKTVVRGVHCDGFACDYAILKEEDVYLLPETISEEEALFVDDIALAVAVLEKLSIERSDYLLLFGASAENILVAQLAIYYQAIPVVIDSDRDRLLKAQSFDVYYTVNPQEENLRQRVMEITGGRFADHAVCDCDSEFFAENLFGLLHSDGNIAMIGFNRAVGRILADVSKIVKYGLAVHGVNNGADFVASAINLLATKAVKVEGLIENLVSFDELPALFDQLAAAPSFYKNAIIC